MDRKPLPLSTHVALILLLSLCRVGIAATVAQVLDGGRRLLLSGDSRFSTGQVVCVVRDSKRVACGLMAVQQGQSLVSLDFRNQMPVAGDLVVTAQEAKGLEHARASSTAGVSNGAGGATVQTNESVRLNASGRDEWLFGGHGNYDLDQFSVAVSMEKFTGPRVTYGLRLLAYDVSNKSPTLSGFGVTLERTFWINRSFHGIFAGLGAGAMVLTIEGPPSTSKPALLLQAHAGWAVNLMRGLVGAASVGIAYCSRPTTDVPIGVFHPLRPTFQLSLGLPF